MAENLESLEVEALAPANIMVISVTKFVTEDGVQHDTEESAVAHAEKLSEEAQVDAGVLVDTAALLAFLETTTDARILSPQFASAVLRRVVAAYLASQKVEG